MSTDIRLHSVRVRNYWDFLRRQLGHPIDSQRTYALRTLDYLFQEAASAGIPLERRQQAMMLAVKRYLEQEVGEGGKPRGIGTFFQDGQTWRDYVTGWIDPPEPRTSIPGVQEDYQPSREPPSSVEEARAWKARYKREVMGE